MEVFRDKSSPGTLDFVRTRLDRLASQGLGNDWGVLWLDRNRLKGGLAGLNDFVATSDGAARSHSGDQNVNATGGIGPNFFGGGFAVDGGVRRVVNCWGIQALGVSLANCSARAIAPFIPSVPGVRTNFAPSMANSVRRSSDMVSGIVKINLYPLAAATKASAIPVFPLVGSIMTVSGLRMPCFSAASIMDMPDAVFDAA